MRLRPTALIKTVPIAALAWCVLAQAPLALAQQPAARPTPPTAGRGPIPVDPRVQMREYTLSDTNEQMPYAIFVSSKVRRDQKAPLIVALHGLGGTPTSLLRGNALDLAEEGGYILVGPMGYNPGGWYGSPIVAGPGRRGGGAAAPAASVGGSAVTEPAKVSELSEKDVLNVLELVRKEFNVDERRTYLMGHSMGGAGTFHLAVKYPQHWAATASIAPAAFRLQPSSLSAIPNMPMMVVHGDMDTLVPVTVGRSWAAAMKELNMTHQYIEVQGGDHGNVITIGMPDIFAFFATHSKPAVR